MGVSVRNTAFSCGCSTASGLKWPLPEEMNDVAIRAILYPKKTKADASNAEINHACVDRELDWPGVTLSLLWSERCESALASGKEPCMCSAFCRQHRSWAAANGVAMRIERKPAREMQVDYVGDTMEVLDEATLYCILRTHAKRCLARDRGGVAGLSTPCPDCPTLSGARRAVTAAWRSAPSATAGASPAPR